MDAKEAYDVLVDSIGLNWEQAGPLFDRYTVALAGRIDRRWVACYNRHVTGAAEYSRFRIEPGTAQVSFTTRSSDGPVQVMSILKKLEALVAKVNREANQELGAERQTKGPREEVGAKPRLSGLAARLGLTRNTEDH